jgi:hypothetical protein
MVMEVDNKQGSIGTRAHKSHVGVGGRAYPEQIGKSCNQQKPGDSEKKNSGSMSWSGHAHKKS